MRNRLEGNYYMFGKTNMEDMISSMVYIFEENKRLQKRVEELESKCGDKDKENLYEVAAYDKDNDIYDVFFKYKNFDTAIRLADSLVRCCKEGRVLSKNGEPYDWIEILNTNRKYVWRV